jgi:hypothetical protein
MLVGIGATDLCIYLIDKGADCSIKNRRGQTPLHLSVERRWCGERSTPIFYQARWSHWLYDWERCWQWHALQGQYWEKSIWPCWHCASLPSAASRFLLLIFFAETGQNWTGRCEDWRKPLNKNLSLLKIWFTRISSGMTLSRLLLLYRYTWKMEATLHLWCLRMKSRRYPAPS